MSDKEEQSKPQPPKELPMAVFFGESYAQQKNNKTEQPKPKNQQQAPENANRYQPVMSITVQRPPPKE